MRGCLGEKTTVLLHNSLYGVKGRNFLSLMLEPSSNSSCCSTGDEELLIKTARLRISGTCTLALSSDRAYEQYRKETEAFVLSAPESPQT